MSDNTERFLSYSQNGEDVVLWRALQTVTGGSYVDVGANHPSIDSVSRAFYNRGWSGLLAEPSPEYAEMLRADRPRDIVVETVVADSTGPVTLHMVQGSGLSTIIDEIGSAHAALGTAIIDVQVPSIPLSTLLSANGFDARPIHFMSIDTEGAEQSVLRSLDFSKHRPWVIVVEATAPNSTRQVHKEWEPILLEADYTFCLFDGLSRFYVAAEHTELAALLSYPVCVFDEFDTLHASEVAATMARQELNLTQLRARIAELETDRAAAREEARRTALELGSLKREIAEVRQDATALRSTLSWRVTAPLRAVHRAIPGQRDANNRVR